MKIRARQAVFTVEFAEEPAVALEEPCEGALCEEEAQPAMPSVSQGALPPTPPGASNDGHVSYRQSFRLAILLAPPLFFIWKTLVFTRKVCRRMVLLRYSCAHTVE